ncbi:uncharacterized protein BCR38DRAFT_193279 [Pseudomassariella vexata]|uniref:Uncharacterized protein n=1 Tax=Pseudomassariella vexata TaxID=1141098 RepID=A0A1Y2E0Z3_9PEZI|nr:uncharacterized protein BCR38DRAFT_193279 [Pseudomassariella vexata]ORY65223.1 hypothetical protein BCR38DRAFT_193279 [Pseudomassariella vexata]
MTATDGLLQDEDAVSIGGSRMPLIMMVSKCLQCANSQIPDSVDDRSTPTVHVTNLQGTWGLGINKNVLAVQQPRHSTNTPGANSKSLTRHQVVAFIKDSSRSSTQHTAWKSRRKKPSWTPSQHVTAVNFTSMHLPIELMTLVGVSAVKGEGHINLHILGNQ